jgi:hypothetical protein
MIRKPVGTRVDTHTGMGTGLERDTQGLPMLHPNHYRWGIHHGHDKARRMVPNDTSESVSTTQQRSR